MKVLSFTFFALLLSGLGLFAQTPYISRVISYIPAPGQFQNQSLPSYVAGDNESTILAKVAPNLVGKTGTMIGLGAYGGTVIVGFDHPIVNMHDYDFKAFGNANATWAEPAIVQVSQDKNDNGLADDEWYELAGSEYGKETTVHDYQITYYRPQYDIMIRNGQTPDIAYINSPATYRTATTNTNIADVRWKDNLGQSGYILRNTFHKQQSYYPMWVEADSLVFNGSLPANQLINTATLPAQNWVSTAFSWGYVDNWANSSTIDKTGFKIDWAVDSSGNPANLTQIDFVKVYACANGDGGWLGEMSTEFAGIQDLHPASVLTNTHSMVETALSIYPNPATDYIRLKGSENANVEIYTLSGVKVLSAALTSSNKEISISELASGTYLIKIITAKEVLTQKLIKR